MKKILTLVAALSAVAGTAMAHDYNWAVAVPSVDGAVEGCSGLSYTKDTQNNKDVFSFEADAKDKITLSVSGENIGVTVGGVDFGVAVENGKVTFEATDGGIVEITLGANTAITNITVVSDAYTTVKKAIDKANKILDARVNNISKFVNLGENKDNNEFYLAVRALINNEGGKLPKLTEILEDFAKQDLMGKAIGDDVMPGYEVDPITINRINGKEYIQSLLDMIETAIGTKVEATNDTEKGGILVDAEAAKAKYDAIVGETETKVAAAKAEIAKQKKNSTSGFYENKDGKWVEKWTAANTDSKTRALDLFKTYVEDYYAATKKSALDALNKFEDQTELDNLPAKFDNVTKYSTNLQKRYDYERAQNLSAGKTNYAAIKALSSEVTALTDLAAKGYKDAKGNILFDNTGLADLKTKADKLFTKISSTENKHKISDLSGEFTTPYTTTNGSIDNVKTNWGTKAKGVLEAKRDEIQKELSECENKITTKYQNDAETLKTIQAKFAAQQVKLNEVKEAVKDISTADKAYNVAIHYNDYDVILNGVREEVGNLWKDAQTAENQAIIDANDKAYHELDSLANELDTYSNTAVARLTKYLNSEFFSTNGCFNYNENDRKAFENKVNASIKTIYDYSAKIKTAKEEAFKLKESKNKPAEGKVESALADLSNYKDAITTNKGYIETALNEAVNDANEKAHDYFANGYVASVKGSINGDSNYPASVKAEITSKATNTIAIADGVNDKAYKDAIKLVNQTVTGTKKNGVLVETETDVASAEKKLGELFTAKQLADDVVGEDVVRTILQNAKNAADGVKVQFDNYAGYKTALYDIQVAWSVNKAAAVTDGTEALKAELETIYGKIQKADKELTETDKLKATAEKYAKTIADLKAAVNKTVDSKTFAAYGEIETAQKNAKTQIDNAKTALAELTKDNAKAALQTAITKAENTVSGADAALDKALADGTFKDQAQTLLDQYKSVDLTKAIEDAQKADKVVPGDLNNDGVVDSKDFEKAYKSVEAETMDDDAFIEFMKVYKSVIGNK